MAEPAEQAFGQAPGQALGQALAFTLPDQGVRGRLVRLGAVAEEILGARAYPWPAACLLAETLALTALLGSLLAAEGGQLTLQVQGSEAPVRLLVADWCVDESPGGQAGALRGYLSLDPDRRLPPPDERADLRVLFGDGRLLLTVDRGADPGAGPAADAAAGRYQGIVDLDAPTLEAAAARYFTASEQVPTLVRLAAMRDGGGRWQAGGLLLQPLPEESGEDSKERFEEVAALAASSSDSELTDCGLAAETLLWRLFHQQRVHLFPAMALRRGCRCTAEHIGAVLGRFPADERAAMRGADGRIAVDCEFCARQFLFDL